MNGYKIVLLKAIFMLYRLPESERVCSGICMAGSSILYQVTEYYENRLELPKNCSCKSHNILFFDENANHLSDQGLGDSFKSFIVWSKEKDAHIIRLQPTDEKYTNYTFVVDTKVCSLEAASYIIWRYFACHMNNKRQGFQPNGIFRLHLFCNKGKIYLSLKKT